MKKKILLSAVMLSMLGTTAYADDYYTTPVFTAPSAGDGAPQAASTVWGKEYSHNSHTDTGPASDTTNLGDHNADLTPDAQQVVSWDGIPGGATGESGSVDSFDYSPFPDKQVDAIANHRDALFDAVSNDAVPLLFSLEHDTEAHIYWEATGGTTGVWVDTGPSNTDSPGTGVGVNHGHPGPAGGAGILNDVDGLEVWGPEPTSFVNDNTTVVDGFEGPTQVADADMFSLNIDSSTGVSVFSYTPGVGTVLPYISQSTIAGSVAALKMAVEDLEIPTFIYDNIDVDALMVKDTNDNREWDIGDEILFSLDPLAFAGTLYFDGGEIFRLVNTAASSVASYLTHGGHVWDTTFDVASHLGLTHLLGDRMDLDIDAIEAVGILNGDPLNPEDLPFIPEVIPPEPGTYALLGTMLGVVAFQRKRRVAV